MRWNLDLGASVAPEGGVRFRVWAPLARSVKVVLYQPAGPVETALSPSGDGLFEAHLPLAKHGDLYKYRLDGGTPVPDPYSRSQPLGVHGPSQVIDPLRFQWHDAGWKGPPEAPQVIYECHIGTFTKSGTFAGAIEQLGYLKWLGVTMVEIMPVAAFPGRWNWGYDGVDLFAPAPVYGGPDGLKQFVDAAHAIGLGVMLDVVYNHFGPDGNYLWSYSRDYFTDRYKTPWGEALNYDGPNSRWVRKLVIDNACYWVNEFHLDGLRLDAIHAIHDSSPVHILREIGERVRASIPPDRRVLLIAEDSRNLTKVIDPVSRGGYGLDGVWSDDFHHAVRTLLTGERHGYYADYNGSLDDIATAINHGFLYQGQQSKFRGGPRGTPVSDQPGERFVFCIQNHDQIGNRPFGDRLHESVSVGQYAAASTLLLLAPETPLLFMGQEFAASSPFLYFTDHGSELGPLITTGRRREFAEFMAAAEAGESGENPDPQAASTFLRSRLRHEERNSQPHRGILELYRQLIAMRASDTVFRVQDRGATKATPVAGSVLAVHRWQGSQHRLILANFGRETRVEFDTCLPEAARGIEWSLTLSTAGYSSRDSDGKDGTVRPPDGGGIVVPAEAAVVLAGHAPGDVAPP